MEIVDPTNFLVNLLSFNHAKSHFPDDHWELNLIGLFGVMGSGKSEMLKYFAKIGNEIYGQYFSCYMTNDIVQCIESINPTPVLFLFVDDAITTGLDSRRSMADENIEQSQNLAVIRHKLAEKRGWGFVSIFYALQDPMRLDAFIRRNLHLAIYKTYYDSLHKQIDKDNEDFLKAITRKSMYEHVYEARSLALAITKTSETFRIRFPRVDYTIQKFDGTKKQNSEAELFNQLMAADYDKKLLKGFACKLNWENNWNLTQSQLLNTIERVIFEKNSQTEPKKQNPETDRNIKCAEIHACLAQGKTREQICKKIGKTLSWVEYNYPRWCKENGIKPIRIKQIRRKLKEIDKCTPIEFEDPIENEP